MKKFEIKSATVFLLCLAQPAGAATPTPAPDIRLPSPISPLSPYSAVTVANFLTACRTDQSACVAEVGNALMNKMKFDGTSDICISSTDYATPVPTWLGSHQNTLNMPTEDGIYLALQSLYPCR